ncbi:MAG: hypothetical protein AAFQ27_14860 [Pseudomonadota bacterium]
MRSVVFAALAASLFVVPVAAEAKAPHFKECDGYKRPTKKGDGLNSGSFLFGLAKRSEDIRRGSTSDDPQLGLEACEKALNDPLLKSEFKERRASLLQAKAFHQLALFSFEDAMTTLDEIETIDTGADPKLYARGIGLGNRLLRSYGLIKEERFGEAMAELDAIDAMRPYSVSTRRTTDKLRLMLDDRLDHQIERLKKRAPIDPAANAMGFLTALEFSRFDDAITFGSGMEFELPKSKGNWRISGESQLNYQLISIRAMFDGGLAYALAATGDDAGATAILLDAREQLELAMTPPPPRKNGRKQKKSVLRDFEQRKVNGARGLEAIDSWAELIQIRKDAPNLDLEQLRERFKALPSSPGPVMIDIISLAGDTELGDRAELVSRLLEIAHTRRTKEFDLSVFNLIRLLPHAEAPENQVRFKRGGDGYFLTDNGFSRREMDTEDDWTIRFTDDTATAATVEEFSMIAAAQEAKKRGYDRLLLQSSRTVQRTTNVYGAYGSQNSGREAQMRVRFIKSDAIPADLAGSTWRMLDVNTVIGDLSDLPQRPQRKRR